MSEFVTAVVALSGSPLLRFLSVVGLVVWMAPAVRGAGSRAVGWLGYWTVVWGNRLRRR